MVLQTLHNLEPVRWLSEGILCQTRCDVLSSLSTPGHTHVSTHIHTDLINKWKIKGFTSYKSLIQFTTYRYPQIHGSLKLDMVNMILSLKLNNYY